MVVFALENNNIWDYSNTMSIFISNVEIMKYYAEMMSYHMKTIARSQITGTRVDACINLIADQRALIIDKIAISKIQISLLSASNDIEFNNLREDDLRIMPEPILGSGQVIL